MRIAYFDSQDPEVRFDNPNLRWGNPSVVLEPGDPGYVEPIPVVSKPTTKGKRVKHDRFYPASQGDQVLWLGNYKEKLPGYGASALGLTAAQVTATVADAGWLEYVLGSWLPAVRAWTQACTEAALAAQTGVGSSALVLPTFTAPALPADVTAQAPGALSRIFALVQAIKKSGKCTDAIAEDLGIVGAQAVAPDLSTVQPILSAKVSGSGVLVGWGWNGAGSWLESCEIVVDRGDGKGFVPLTVDTTPNYTDTAPFPSAKTVWSYKAIYRANDGQVGRWSQPVSVAVGG